MGIRRARACTNLYCCLHEQGCRAGQVQGVQGGQGVQACQAGLGWVGQQPGLVLQQAEGGQLRQACQGRDERAGLTRVYVHVLYFCAGHGSMGPVLNRASRMPALVRPLQPAWHACSSTDQVSQDTRISQACQSGKF